MNSITKRKVQRVQRVSSWEILRQVTITNGSNLVIQTSDLFSGESVFNTERTVLTHYLGSAVLDDSLHLLVNKFHTPKTRFFQSANLPLHKQFECDFRHKKCRSRTRGISNCREDVQSIETPKRIDTTQSAVEDFVKDITDTGTSAQLGGLDVLRDTVDSIAVGRVEPRDYLKQQLPLSGR